MYFNEVYRAVGKKNETINYELINSNIEINDLLLASLERSGMARVVSKSDGKLVLYYEVKKEL